MLNPIESSSEITASGEVCFANGADLSLLKRNMDSGFAYKVNDVAGDPIVLLRQAGLNYARLRLFHRPSLRGAQVNDLVYTLSLARQLVKAGFKLLLDFHYSDTWADPGKQTIPRQWESLSFDKLAEAVYHYTRDVVEAFVKAGAGPDMVQIGNEITPGMLWDHGRVAEAHEANTLHWTREASSNNHQAWERLGKLLKAGIRGVHDAAEKPTKIMIHIDRGGDLETSRWFFDKVLNQGVDFDVIGQSYYPFWHGMPDDLRVTLDSLSVCYGKDLYVVETAYPWKYHDIYKDSLSGDHAAWHRLTSEYPLSPEGQLNFTRDVIELVKGTVGGRGKGVFYWAPEWSTPPRADFVDEGDAEPCWARALFDDEGNALPALYAFNGKGRASRRVVEVDTNARNGVEQARK